MDTPKYNLTVPREQLSLRQRVIDTLRENIVFGAFEPGQKLVERDLCESLGVSRTVIREALQQLQAEGLISNVVHKGPSVAVITLRDAREIYAVRELLERAATEEFSRNASDEEIDRLEAVVDRLRAPEVPGDAHLQIQLKNDFYEVLLEGAGNRVITQMLTLLTNRSNMLRRTSMARPGRLEEVIEELEAIIQAMRERKHYLAGELCANHVAAAAKNALASYDEQPRVLTDR